MGDFDSFAASLGLPASNPTPASPAAIADPNQNQNSGFISTLQSFGSSVLHGTESAIETTYGAIKTVGSDAVSGVEGVVGYGVNQVVIVVAVVGIALYFIAKTGAIKAVIPV